MRTALARHDALVRAAIETRDGHLFTTAGEAFCAAFRTAPDALAAAIALGRSEHERAVRLWAAAQRLRQEIGVPMPPSEQHDHARQLAAVRDAIGLPRSKPPGRKAAG